MIERFFISQSMKKIELENYVKSQLGSAGFTNLEIVKTPLVTRIVLHVVRPGLAIGKGGQTINQLTEEIRKRFGIENPQIEIKEIPNPEIDAKANVDKIVSLLERDMNWRTVVFRIVNDIMNAGAQGVELILSGKLAGKGGRKRRVRIAQGYMKKVGDQVKLTDFAKATAYPKPGAIGVRVRIVHPGTQFPDKINLEEKLAKKTVQEEKAPEEAKEEVVLENKKEEKTEEKKPVSKTSKKRKKAGEGKESGEAKEGQKKDKKESSGHAKADKEEKTEKKHAKNEKSDA